MGLIIVTDNTFKEMISGSPVLVDFWAAWCGPCRMLAPTLEEIAKEYDGTSTSIAGIRKLRVAKLDVDANEKIALEFGVRAIPTMILFKDGQEVLRLVGAQSKSQIIEKISSHI